MTQKWKKVMNGVIKMWSTLMAINAYQWLSIDINEINDSRQQSEEKHL